VRRVLAHDQRDPALAIGQEQELLVAEQSLELAGPHGRRPTASRARASCYGPPAHLADLGVRVERVMTDQAKNYVLSRVFTEALSEIGARHIVARPYRPQSNGKAERFNRTHARRVGLCTPLPLQRSEACVLPRWIQTYNGVVLTPR
jgi:Integrase core domain